MSKSNKKNFVGGISSLLQPTVKQDPEQSELVEINPITEHQEKRATFIIQVEYLDKINSIAYWERTLLKDQINAALGNYIKQYEEQNGPIRPVPKK